MLHEEINQEIGARMRERRGKLARWEVAAKSGLSPETIGRFERGEGCPSLGQAFRIAAALGCKVSDLIPEIEEAVA